MRFPYIPKELVNIILEFDGRIKYRNGEYVNIIYKHDTRYQIVNMIIIQKMRIIKNMEINGSRFYFDIPFDKNNTMGLVYDYNWSFDESFEICYYDWRNIAKIIQLRVVL
jgi:hypothetical protein